MKQRIATRPVLPCILVGAVLLPAAAQAAPPSAGVSGSPVAQGASTQPGAAPPPQSVPAQPGASAPNKAADDEEAATRFKRGLQLFDEGDYTLALVEFERAYQLAPNYKALYNIALVNVQLGRYADATRTFEKYLHDGGDEISADRRAKVESTLAELKLRTATLEITVNPSIAEVTIDGKPIEASRLSAPLLIDAGEHSVRATAPGYQPGFRTLTLAGADRSAVKLDLVAFPHAAEAPQERGRSLFWPGFVATGALAVGAIVSGVVMLDARSRLTSLQNQQGSSPSQRASAAHESNTAGLVADILTGTAIVVGGVSVALSLRVDHSPKTPATAYASPELSLSGAF